MNIFILVALISIALGDQCFRTMKPYIRECEFPNSVSSEYCTKLRQDVASNGCEQALKDFDICKNDLKTLCSPDKENPHGCFGRCLFQKISQLSSECANTETVKRIMDRIKNGRFPTNTEPTIPSPLFPPVPPLPPKDSDITPPNADVDQITKDMRVPPRETGYPPMGFPREEKHHRIRHSESDRDGYNHHFKRWHHKCNRRFAFVVFVCAALISTVGLVWVLRERQRRAFLRRSRIISSSPPGNWSTGLFGSWDRISPDWKTCIPSFLFPCFQNALNQAELQDRDCSFADFFFNICKYQRASNTYRDRQEIRSRYNIPEDSCGDCLVSVFCSPCAIAQNSREIDIRTCAQGGTQWPAQKVPDTWVPAKADLV